MKNSSLIFTFHNPNDVDITANRVLTVLIQANMAKIESEILHILNDEKKKKTYAYPNRSSEHSINALV